MPLPRSNISQAMITVEDRQHLNYLTEAITEISSFTEGEDYQSFELNETAKEEVSRLLQDVGGAAKMLSDDFKGNYGDIDWDVLISLENAMYNQAHEHGIEGMWHVISKDLPSMIDQITDLASNLDEEEDIQGFDLTPNDPNTY